MTIPNLLTLFRLGLIAVFGWLMLGPQADLWAAGVLVLAGITDFLDGELARRLGQFSRLGSLLDPAADRLFVLVVVAVTAVRGIVPWWLVVALVLRDLVLLALVPLLRTRGHSSLPVHFLGKAATFTLLCAFPLLVLGDGSGHWHTLARVFGWAFAGWGLGLYWWSAVMYVGQVRRLVREHPPIGGALDA
ncbi:MAG: CDP-alcohol phosphatidyltransferase family protein [Nocardioides sp.]|uniref:CDP-alcohol phosphatidyltransferase family protein n=1 Tax=Nocardioides sp. TaxID=35761 RepID=UPI0039E5B9F3